MKNIFKKLRKAAVALALGFSSLVAASAAPTPVAPSLFGATNATFFSLTNGLYGIATAGTSNLNTVPFPLYRGRGFAFHLTVYTTNASGSNVNITLQFATPHLGYSNLMVTNWENPLSINFANNSGGNSNNILGTNIPATIVDNYTLGRFQTATNQHLSTLFLDPTNSYVTEIP